MTRLNPLNSTKFFCPDCGITEAGKCPCSYTVEPSVHLDRWERLINTPMSPRMLTALIVLIGLLGTLFTTFMRVYR